jgi:hypothetical protein
VGNLIFCDGWLFLFLFTLKILPLHPPLKGEILFFATAGFFLFNFTLKQALRITRLNGRVIPEGGSFIIIKTMPLCDGWLFLFNFTLKQALGLFQKKTKHKCLALIILAEK